jgi:hypothetical protein
MLAWLMGARAERFIGEGPGSLKIEVGGCVHGDA